MADSRTLAQHSNDFDIALAIVDEIKKNVTCMNDIIPFKKFKLFKNKQLPSTELLQLTLAITEQNRYIKKLRDTSQVVITYQAVKGLMDTTDLDHNRIIMRLATTSFGFGECGENTELAHFKLKQAGIKTPIYFFSLQSEDFTIFSTHAFLVIGDCQNIQKQKFSSPSELINALKTLPGDYILVDAFFNIVSYIKDFPVDFEEILMNDKFNHIVWAGLRTCSKESAKIAQNAKILIETMCSQLCPTEFPKIVYYTGLLADYQTVSCKTAQAKDVFSLQQQLNYIDGKPRTPKIMITNPVKFQISFLRTWLKSADKGYLGKALKTSELTPPDRLLSGPK